MSLVTKPLVDIPSCTRIQRRELQTNMVALSETRSFTNIEVQMLFFAAPRISLQPEGKRVGF